MGSRSRRAALEDPASDRTQKDDDGDDDDDDGDDDDRSDSYNDYGQQIANHLRDILQRQNGHCSDFCSLYDVLEELEQRLREGDIAPRTQ
mmetsp:Transcript_6014/g.8279  ORF Transcript_6014/g.8279 Transcript_6014/m.8279 type:complete len:90 (+) Transcript_6014:778-1047(+)